jgi:GNAT superfamily N-acetyltransferase
MKWDGYELSSYSSEDVDGILEILSFLWGADKESNRNYFSWKHQANPLLKKPVGIVAKYEGQVVGFGALIPAEWRMGDRKFMVILGADTVVHPEHRRKGLNTAIAKLVWELYCNEYRFHLSFSPNRVSTLVDLKAGWKPIGIRSYLRHPSPLGLAKEKLLGANTKALNLGTFGDVQVSDTIRPVDISRIDASNYYSINKLCLNKSPDFLKWRLSNSKANFIYFYHLKESEINAYVILRLNKTHAHVFDYGEENGSFGVQRLISFILQQTRFASISFLTATTPDDLNTFLCKKHFYTFDRIERIRNR